MFTSKLKVLNVLFFPSGNFQFIYINFNHWGGYIQEKKDLGMVDGVIEM